MTLSKLDSADVYYEEHQSPYAAFQHKQFESLSIIFLYGKYVSRLC